MMFETEKKLLEWAYKHYYDVSSRRWHNRGYRPQSNAFSREMIVPNGRIEYGIFENGWNTFYELCEDKDVESFIERDSSYGVNITWLFEDKPLPISGELGLTGKISRLQNRVGDFDLEILEGEQYVSERFTELLQYFDKHIFPTVLYLKDRSHGLDLDFPHTILRLGIRDNLGLLDDFLAQDADNLRYEIIIGTSRTIYDTHDSPAWDEFGDRLYYMDKRCDPDQLLSFIRSKGYSSLWAEARPKENPGYFVIDLPENSRTEIEKIINLLLGKRSS